MQVFVLTMAVFLNITGQHDLVWTGEYQVASNNSYAVFENQNMVCLVDQELKGLCWKDNESLIYNLKGE